MARCKYTVVVVSLGDGTVDYGRRVVMHDFLTKRAATQAAGYINNKSVDGAGSAVVVEDILDVDD